MGRSNLRPAPLELELRAELQEPSLQDIGRRLPRRSERVVLRQNRARVQQVENVERRLDAPAAYPTLACPATWQISVTSWPMLAPPETKPPRGSRAFTLKS